jgi:hypothetical protein
LGLGLGRVGLVFGWEEMGREREARRGEERGGEGMSEGGRAASALTPVEVGGGHVAVATIVGEDALGDEGAEARGEGVRGRGVGGCGEVVCQLGQLVTQRHL